MMPIRRYRLRTDDVTRPDTKRRGAGRLPGRATAAHAAIAGRAPGMGA